MLLVLCQWEAVVLWDALQRKLPLSREILGSPLYPLCWSLDWYPYLQRQHEVAFHVLHQNVQLFIPPCSLIISLSFKAPKALIWNYNKYPWQPFQKATVFIFMKDHSRSSSMYHCIARHSLYSNEEKCFHEVVLFSCGHTNRAPLEWSSTKVVL